MIYAIKNSDGATEVREDQYPLPKDAVEITKEERDGLLNGTMKFENGQIVSSK